MTSKGLWQPASASSSSGSAANQGPRRVGQWVYLRPERVDEYKKCHREVWPEVLGVIGEVGIRDYSIFLTLTPRPTLFASFKYVGTAFDKDMARMAAHPKVQEWWRMTDGMQESPVEGATGSKGGPGWWGGMEEVFYLE